MQARFAQGVATPPGVRLIETALDWARATPPFAWVDLDVLSANLPARRLYERTGFQVVGEFPAFIVLTGNPSLPWR